MNNPAIRSHVVLHRAEGTGPDRKHVAHDALVIGKQGELLTVVFIDPAMENRLGDVNWSDAFEKVFDVPPGDEDEGNGHYFYTPMPSVQEIQRYVAACESAHKRDIVEKAELRQTVLELTAKLAETTEGKDAALQAAADAMAKEHALPSGADLDAVAAEVAAAEATGVKTGKVRQIKGK